MARVDASRFLLAPRRDVWALLAEPYHLPDWWPGYTAVRPDRRGFSEGARWTVVRSLDPGLLRRPGGEGTIVLGDITEGSGLSWHDVQQQFTGTITLRGEDDRTEAHLVLEASWWRIRMEGLARLPAQSLARLHDLCQTAAGL